MILQIFQNFDMMEQFGKTHSHSYLTIPIKQKTIKSD